ncbi:MAG: serine--tRNA ligase [Myxococcota bacterium]|jgi:seryl-tRNA synthetase|nr:serine--tRNA ligase [bacterium]MDP6073501.1 serine--tRNA ligase [Myxococcota bacterium]MDP6242849.1 serine--tRNA ligase [Myxococcota bacterium]MDP7076134.1 serine--tRNA ligase [Myxococcota bacterium]MDP7301039.1 serine--tRNA ligase [Myxococcota bacterium]
MLDPRELAKRRDEVVESCRRRAVRADVDAAVAARGETTQLRTELQEWNQRRKEHQAASKKALGPEEREAHAAAGRQLKEEAGNAEKRLAEAERILREHMLEIPNFVHPEVPEGGEDDFRELRRIHEPPSFGFEARDHLALGKALDLFDFESGAKVTGQKFYFLKNELVLVELALQRFALDVAREAGFTLHSTPDLARRTIVDHLAFSPRGDETNIYSVADTDLDLVGTAEITLGGLGADVIFEESELPVRLAGLSHCFRTEAGSHGRESKGLYRVHQFSKVELFTFCHPETSEALHEEILGIEEQILQTLEIPYRVIDVASGDLGAPAYRKYDIEAWMPGRGEGGSYGEVTSASNCTNFQSRRLKTRFRRTGAKKNDLVHTLNGTAVATPRLLIPLLENHQQADGSVAVPEGLRQYTGFDRIGPR